MFVLDYTVTNSQSSRLICFNKIAFVHCVFSLFWGILIKVGIIIVSKCMPILLYGLDACPVNKTDLRSLDFTVDRF